MSDIIRTVALAILIGLLGIGAGWNLKASRVALEASRAQVAAVTETVKTEREIVYVTNEVVKEVEKVKTVYKDVIKYQDREVIKYVQTPAASLPFGVDDVWLLNFNASALACDPAVDTCVARSTFPGSITRAEALAILREQHQLYQACRINNNGLIDFYNEIRKTVNKGELNATDADPTADHSQ
ncbi:hypothetical protein [Delftia phage PhiW-14]|uniref:Uncharacterized protein n=1 Tax=Delftia phage PhiW-14 TaxID=665032 RepID=C9DFY4_BPW14|nr:hypothetical protein DP-phiW-14_gp012 [Delftia phage PhiW-14]ACV50035.1 hypothetical protein [Delftia phage PhiW-14]